uniref:Uncharacterized protein n=1 Tax=Anguilla anguilla TaxID=7936 RepID=A0A0E9TA28_ANGAN
MPIIYSNVCKTMNNNNTLDNL